MRDDGRRARPGRDVSDRVLVAAAQAGDADAFALLVERHQASMYRLAVRMLGSEADAQDVAQDAFVRAWRSIARFRGDSAFSTWMYRITTNRCLQHIAQRRPVAPLDEGYAQADGDAAHEVEQRMRFVAVTEAIGALAPELRAAIVLRDLQGLSYEEIAEVLGVELTTVRGRIHRARLKVIDTIGAQG